MLASGRYTLGDFVSEAHYKLSLPLLAMVYPMIALVTLLAGGYRRSGFGRRVVVAIAVAALLQVLVFAVRARVQERPELWPLMYLPVARRAALRRHARLPAEPGRSAGWRCR